MNKCGTLVRWYWKGEAEALGDWPVPAPLCPPQITHELLGSEPGPSWWKEGDWPLELWQGWIIIRSIYFL